MPELPGIVVVKVELLAEAIAEPVREASAVMLLTMATLLETLALMAMEVVAPRVAVWKVVGMAVTVEAPAGAVALGVLLLPLPLPEPEPPAPAMRAGPGMGYSVLAW